jgi:hypothetical protein
MQHRHSSLPSLSQPHSAHSSHFHICLLSLTFNHTPWLVHDLAQPDHFQSLPTTLQHLPYPSLSSLPPLPHIALWLHASLPLSPPFRSFKPDAGQSGTMGAPRMHRGITTVTPTPHWPRSCGHCRDPPAVCSPSIIYTPHPLPHTQTGRPCSTLYVRTRVDLKSGVRTAVALLVREIQHLKEYRLNHARYRLAIAPVYSPTTHDCTTKIMRS